MYDDILVPVDGNAGADAILRHTRDLAGFMDATVHVLYVADTSRDSVTTVGTEVVDALGEEGESIVEAAGKTVGGIGVDYDTDVVAGDPAATIVEYADQYDYDLIVMPTHGRTGVDRTVFGSVTEKVVRLASVPVLCSRMAGDEQLSFPYDDLLVAVDGSDAARAAADHAIDLADALGATLHVLGVVEDDTDVGADTDHPMTTVLSTVVDTAQDRGLTADRHLEHGDPATVIRDTITEVGIDAVVMGRTGRRGLERILLGSVAERTIRTATVPVLTVPD